MTLRLRIRTRLTLAYTAIVLVLLVAMGLTLYVALRLQLNEAADKELSTRSNAIAHFLQFQDLHRNAAGLAHELREHSELDASGTVVQLSDGEGNVLYRSPGADKIDLSGASSGRFRDVRSGHRIYRALRDTVSLSQRYTLDLAQDQSEDDEAIERLGALLLLGVPISLALSFLAGWWMSGRVLQPIHRITATVLAIDDRRLTVRLPLAGSGDELDTLSATLNGMLDRLQQAFERVRRFTADASHELRTPLTLIRGNAEMMQTEAYPSPRSQEIMDEADRMECLIQDLLMLARSDEGSQTPFELVDPADLTERAALVGRHLVADRHLSFLVQGPKAIYPLYGSDQALSRVLVVLLDNAVRHTPDGGTVRLTVTSSLAECTMEVADTGAGIESRHLPHIFDRFYRVDDARNRAMGGAGLGLAIAHAVIAAHGGTITVKSDPGRGSIFTVHIPATTRRLRQSPATAGSAEQPAPKEVAHNG
jgi:heavy metal sensor kinase